MKNKKLNKALSVVANVVVYVFCALCLLLVLFTVFSKRDSDGAVKVLGYEMRIVVSGSMEKHPDVDVSNYKIKSIKTGSIVFVKLAPQDEQQLQQWYDDLQVGDVLTFSYFEKEQQVITHRITDIQPNGSGGYVITLRGDNLSDSGATSQQIIDTSDENSYNHVIGKVTGHNFIFGWFVYSLKQPIGMALVIIVPCLVIMVWNVVKIVSVLRDKKDETVGEQSDSEVSGEQSD